MASMAKCALCRVRCGISGSISPGMGRHPVFTPLDQTIDPDQVSLCLHEARQDAVQQSPSRIALDVHRHAEADRALAITVEHHDVAIVPHMQHRGSVALDQCKRSHHHQSTHGASRSSKRHACCKAVLMASRDSEG